MESVEEFRRRADRWLADNRGSAPPDYGAILPPDLRDAAVAWQRRLFDARLTGITWPTAHGGLGLGGEHHRAWLEAAARAGVPPYLNMVGYVLAGGAIQRFGTEAQQRRFLAPILRGEEVWCQLFSEPGAGSDLASLRTAAVPDGDSFVVNGHKVWCSNGRVADQGILLARTDPDVPRHRGISFFLLDMRLPGVEVRPLRQMTGEAHFDEVFLTDVRLPAAALVGAPGDGWRVAMATLTDERGSVVAGAIGLQRKLAGLTAGAAAGGARDRANLGEGDPTRAAHTAVARQRSVRLYERGWALLAMLERQGPVAATSASLSKLGMSELNFDGAVVAADLCGPDAVLEGEVGRALTAAPAGRIAGGTSQVQRTIIGERLLGLPREPGG